MDANPKDPSFRSQYDTEPKPDPEFDALLAGAPAIRIAPAKQITHNGQVWLPPLRPSGKLP